jgi:hypothetical protein
MNHCDPAHRSVVLAYVHRAPASQLGKHEMRDGGERGLVRLAFGEDTPHAGEQGEKVDFVSSAHQNDLLQPR